MRALSKLTGNEELGMTEHLPENIFFLLLLLLLVIFAYVKIDDDE